MYLCGWRNWLLLRARRCWQDEHGQGVVLELLVWTPVLLLLLGLAVLVLRGSPAKVTVNAAARACARQAAVTLNAPQGLAQGVTAGTRALESGHLDPEQATLTVTPLGPWGRASAVECVVTYRADLRGVPLLSLLRPGSPYLTLTATASSRVEPYKSRWGGPP